MLKQKPPRQRASGKEGKEWELNQRPSGVRLVPVPPPGPWGSPERSVSSRILFRRFEKPLLQLRHLKPDLLELLIAHRQPRIISMINRYSDAGFVSASKISVTAAAVSGAAIMAISRPKSRMPANRVSNASSSSRFRSRSCTSPDFRLVVLLHDQDEILRILAAFGISGQPRK